MLKQYLRNLQETINRGDAREESYYKHLEILISDFASANKIKKVHITTLPKKTDAGNPDFRVWDGGNHITGYIEAKDPSVTNLDVIQESEQLKRYRTTFPNVILTNFYEFRLYRDSELIKTTTIARPVIAKKLSIVPPLGHEDQFNDLMDTFFSFSLPQVRSAKTLAMELAKRTKFLRDEVVSIELRKKEKHAKKSLLGFYEAFKKYLIGTLTEQTFADLYSQTITYGLFAARSRSDNSFNRELAFKYIPNTIGILRDVFKFISLEEPPKPLQVTVDDIAEVLNVSDVNKILHDYYREGKGKDPIVHFYETFLAAYDPSIRERRGVYYTPEPVVGYIIRSIHQILKTHFKLADGLASPQVTLLDPAGGTLTFPAEALKVAVQEYTDKYGEGGKTNLIRNQILPNYYAFELMMAPYAIGHLKMSFLFEELGYRLKDDERFNLYLTNTLEMEDLAQVDIPGLSSLSEESHLAGKVKKDQLYNTMRHMLEGNLGLNIVRQVKTGESWQHCLISNTISESCYISNRTSEIGYVFPMYLYKEKSVKKLHFQSIMLFEPEAEYGKERIPNIDKAVYEKLNKTYKKKLTPEEILYYIYSIFCSNIYREKYVQFLKIDFPCMPFTADYKLFKSMADFGHQLTDLHLMKSDLLNKPIAKYQGKGDHDRIEKIVYSDKEQRVYINKQKYFDNISSELWNYQIGGYQVLQKYLKDRKDRTMDDPRYYCKIVTSIQNTINIQNQIDAIYEDVEKEVIAI